jgi:hypothetical protein
MLRALGFALLLLCAATKSFGAVGYDNSASGGGSSVTSVSFSLTNTAGNLVHIGTSFRQNLDSAVSSATYNAVSATKVPSSTANNGTYYTELYTLTAPATGANTAQVNYSGNAAFDVGVVATSFTGVDQTTPVGTAAIASGTSATPSVTVSDATADDFVIDQLAITHSATLTVGANQTQRANFTAAGFIKTAASTQDGADGGAMTWTNGDSQAWAISAVAIKAAAAGGAAATGFLGLVGMP